MLKSICLLRTKTSHLVGSRFLPDAILLSDQVHNLTIIISLLFSVSLQLIAVLSYIYCAAPLLLAVNCFLVSVGYSLSFSCLCATMRLSNIMHSKHKYLEMKRLWWVICLRTFSW